MSEEAVWLRDLFFELVRRQPERTFERVLEPWLPRTQDAIRELIEHRRYETASPGCAAHEALWKWYALSRVNDYLLLGFSPRQGNERRRCRDTTGCLELGDFDVVTQGEYEAFFSALGFQLLEDVAYSPFHHEIVEVAQDESIGAWAVIDHVFWPGLRFGELMFSRAGVRVRAPRRALVKEIAERSTMYFTYRRGHRDTADLSMGWGSNSQWRTDFRRDYETATRLYYNVDGGHVLGSGCAGREINDDLTEPERIELLTHRCLVTCPKRSDDRWPYDDTYACEKGTR